MPEPESTSNQHQKSPQGCSRRLSWILFCHFVREFLTPFFCCLGGFVTLFTVMELFNVLPDFLSAKAGLPLLVRYLLLMEPQQLLFAVIPMSALLAASFMVVSLTRHHEISALRASGVSLFWCCLPVWLVGLLLSLGSFSLSYWPLATHWSAEARVMLKTIDVPKTGMIKSKTEGCSLSRDGLRWWTVGRFSAKGLQREVTITRFHAEPGRKSIGGNWDWNLAAAEAFYDAKTARWIFHDSELADPDPRGGVPALPKAEGPRPRQERLAGRPVMAVFRRLAGAADVARETKARELLDREAKDGDVALREVVFAARVDWENDKWCFRDCVVEAYDDKGRLVSATPSATWTPAPPATGRWPAPVPESAILNLPEMSGRFAKAFWAEGIKSFDVGKGKFVFSNALRIKYVAGQASQLEFLEVFPHVSSLWVFSYDQPEAGAGMEDIARLWAATLTYEQRDGRWVWRYQNGLVWKTGEILNPPYRLADGVLPVFPKIAQEPEVVIADTLQDISNLNGQMEFLSSSQLWQVLEQNPDMNAKTRTEYRVRAWNRCFLGLMPFIAVFLGVAFSLTGERANAASGFAKALGLMLSYYVVDQLCVAAGNAGMIPWPWLAGGGATIGYGLFAVATMWRRQ
jgi:lipopolysaccharide export LptBFGC system permease protein LptF